MLTATAAGERCIVEMGDDVAIRIWMLEAIRAVKGSSYFVSCKHKCQLYESRSLPTATATKDHVKAFRPSVSDEASSECVSREACAC